MKSHTLFGFMRKSLFVLVLVIAALPAHFDESLNARTVEHPAQPLPPDTSMSIADTAVDIEAAARDVADALHPETRLPAQIVIPSLKINSWVEHVGTNAAGEIEVPDGSTRNVGWYKFGTVPGDIGSAVMDAHVYAAFKNLKKAKIGSSIYVLNTRGETLHFKVISSKVYPLAQVPMDVIVNDNTGNYLNLITCEGSYSWTRGTYSHRRVVYAELAP